ncbi:hypothetical protein PVM12_10390 [Enterobacter soli]|nr:hypothetical protein [Enterobacter soli]MDD9244453.1 hypothetical protein [Enterobacter soli]
MSFFKLIIFVFCFHAFSVFAGTINCEVTTDTYHNRPYNEWSEIHVPFELKPSGLTMTVGAKIPDWQVIYSAYVNIGMETGTCNSGTHGYFTFLTQAQNVGTIDGNEIYSTDIPGIGVSVSASEDGNAAVKPYPSVVEFGTSSHVGYCFWAIVKYWKIPGEIPMNSGPITVTGPDAAIVYMSSGNTFTSSQADKITSDGKAYIREGANKQVISSQADSLIKISRIWADFFPANTSNQPI